MNERIKLLAIQAGIEFTYDPTETPMRAFAECWEDELAKFAQLIVAECVRIVAKRKDQAIDDGWNVDEAMSMAEMDLEEHFGVEE